MIKKIFFLLTIFLLSFSVTFAAAKPGTDNSPAAEVEQRQDLNSSAVEQDLAASVVDTAKILGKNQIQTLTEKIQQLEQKHKIRVGINFLKTIGNRDIDNVANERLRKNFGNGQNGGALLTVVMDNRKWNITLDAKLTQRISSYSDVADYSDSFYNNLHDDNFFDAANVYLDSIDALLNYYETNGKPYDRSQEFDPMALMIAFVIAVIIGFLIRSWLIGSMSNVKFASEATNYLKRDSIRMTEERDTYLYTNVTRHQKSRGSNSSSGGRGGGGGSSGGGSF